MRIVLLTCMLVLGNFSIGFGQDDEDPPIPCDECPIDGGASILVALGVIYGIKKRTSENNKK